MADLLHKARSCYFVYLTVISDAASCSSLVLMMRIVMLHYDRVQ